MKKLLIYLPLVFLLVQCTLSAKQEASLNAALSKYIQARNDCQVVGLVGFTYPGLVKDFKEQGDSSFQHKFDCDKNLEYYYAIQNATLRETMKKDSKIHVLYEFDGYGEKEDEYMKRNFKLVAISENDGENWFFMPWTDYQNNELCKSLDRLIKKK